MDRDVMASPTSVSTATDSTPSPPPTPSVAGLPSRGRDLTPSRRTERLVSHHPLDQAACLRRHLVIRSRGVALRGVGGHAATRMRSGVILLSALLLMAACAETPVQPPVSVSTPPPASTSGSAPPVAAGPVLTRLADHLSDAPADTTTGGYQYVERRTWYRDIIGPPGPTGWPERIRTDQLWRTDNADKGREVSAHVTADGCSPHDRDSSWTNDDGDPFDQPPPRTPARLRAHLLRAAGPEKPRPQHIVGGIAMLNERQALTRPVRATALRLLAEQPGLLVRTGVTDRLHRPGTDVILPHTDPSGVPRHDTLTIDPTTGVLLAAYSTITGPIPPLDPSLGTDAKAAIVAEADSYRLYVDNRRVPTTRAPAADCKHPTARR